MTDPETLARFAAEVVKLIQPERVEPIVPLAEAAKMLKMQPCTLRNLVYKNKIGFIVDGKSYYFKVSDLNRYIDEHYTPRDEDRDDYSHTCNCCTNGENYGDDGVRCNLDGHWRDISTDFGDRCENFKFRK